MPQKFLYDDYILGLATAFEAKLGALKVVYNFDLGDEFEIAICEVLRSFLPRRFGLCRGFVVASNGEHVGDDIIVFDHDRFPTLRMLDRDRYDRKEKIPVEAVYAYIEAKHSFTKDTFNKGAAQVARVKQLVSQRQAVNLSQTDPYQPMPAKIGARTLPTRRNPIYGAVWCRRVEGNDNEQEKTVREALDSFQMKPELMPFSPDFVLAGSRHFLRPAILDDNKPTLHWLEGQKMGYQVCTAPDVAFGAALAALAAATAFVLLGRMPWEDILNDAQFPASS